MEEMLNTSAVVFILGQIACFVGYFITRFSWQFLLVLQVMIAGFSLLLWGGHGGEIPYMDAPLLAHILAVVTAHWFLIFSFASGILVSIKERAIKNHKLRNYLPSLVELERNQFQFLALSLGAMMAAVGLGEWYLYSTYNVWFVWNTKIILSVVLCIAIAILLWMHHRFGTRGQQAAKWVLLFYIIFGVVLTISHV